MKLFLVEGGAHVPVPHSWRRSCSRFVIQLNKVESMAVAERENWATGLINELDVFYPQ